MPQYLKQIKAEAGGIPHKSSLRLLQRRYLIPRLTMLYILIAK